MERRKLLSGMGAVVSSMIVSAEPSSLLPAAGSSFQGEVEAPEREGMKQMDSLLDKKTLADWLGSEFDLRSRLAKGTRSYYRLWQTMEMFAPNGELTGRNQWRGDLSREVKAVGPSGRATEAIAWNTAGFRNWELDKNRYGAAIPLPWTNGFAYEFSIEEFFDELKFDYSSIPKDLLGVTFRQAFQVSAHFEFDFLRSSRHAAIEKLRKVGDLNLDTPGEGETFSLAFPPIITNSVLTKKNVQVGFLGLTQVGGAPCGILDYREGPQRFRWDMTDPTFSMVSGDASVKTWHNELMSWQNGQFLIRLSDGALAEGEFVENHMLVRNPLGVDTPTPACSRGIWSIRQISKADFEAGLQGWDQEQSATPWHCYYGEFRVRK